MALYDHIWCCQHLLDCFKVTGTTCAGCFSGKVAFSD